MRFATRDEQYATTARGDEFPDEFTDEFPEEFTEDFAMRR
jgi:hypothetical protein